jgi:hypothetical protein
MANEGCDVGVASTRPTPEILMFVRDPSLSIPAGPEPLGFRNPGSILILCAAAAAFVSSDWRADLMVKEVELSMYRVPIALGARTIDSHLK